MTYSTAAAYPAIDWVFLAIGVVFVLVALIIGPRWWQTVTPIDFSSEKFGTIKIPFVPLLVLVGVAFAGVGVYFRWQGGQSALAQQHDLREKLDNLTLELDRFKNYEMNVQLDFHTSVDPTKLHTNLLVVKPGIPSPRLIDQGILRSTQVSNILLATVDGLGPGDMIYFAATETGANPVRSWESERLVIPVAQLNMVQKQ